jgi:hypothetical protein
MVMGLSSRCWAKDLSSCCEVEAEAAESRRVAGMTGEHGAARLPCGLSGSRRLAWTLLAWAAMPVGEAGLAVGLPCHAVAEAALG